MASHGCFRPEPADLDAALRYYRHGCEFDDRDLLAAADGDVRISFPDPDDQQRQKHQHAESEEDEEPGDEQEPLRGITHITPVSF